MREDAKRPVPPTRILLTAKERELYHIYECTKSEINIRGYGGRPQDLAQATIQMYSKEGRDGS